jgi:molecular chaperone HscA
VVAIDLDAAKPAWTSRDPLGTAPRWKSMTALPIGVAVFTDVDTDTRKRRMVLLGAAHGDVLWQATLADDDVMYFAGTSAIVADRDGKRLVGLDVATGTERWSLLDPPSTSSLDSHVIVVTTPKDLAGPATVFGRPYQPDLTDDPRVVQIAADRSARVIDADSGKVLTTRQNVADPDDEVVAHNGRLIVLQPDDQRIVSYQLKKLGEPRVLYTTQAQNSQMKDVTPCGDDRVCFDEEIGYDGRTATVVALDVSDGSRPWRYPLANADSLVPVGEAILATTTAADTTLIGADGKKVWTHTGEAARLDGGNLLEFSKPLSRSPGDPALAGRHLGDEAVPLGSFSDIRSDTCSWNTHVLACVADKDFVLLTFTK